MIILSSYSPSNTLTLSEIEKLKINVTQDVSDNNKTNRYIMNKVNKILKEIMYWFSDSSALHTARNELYKLCESEHKYNNNTSTPISREAYNVLIDSIHTLKSLTPPGQKSEFYLSLGENQRIDVNIGSAHKITLPTVSKDMSSEKIDFINKNISDDRKENLHRFYPLSLSTERVLLSAKNMEKLQKIYTNGKKDECAQASQEKTLEQLALDNARDCNLEQHIYVNGVYHKPLENYKEALKIEENIKRGKQYIRDSQIFQSITKIDKITDKQINALCEHLCQTSMNLMLGTLFASTEIFDRQNNSGATLSFRLNQERRIEYETSLPGGEKQPEHSKTTRSKPETTLINIEKTSTDDIIITNKYCITPKYQTEILLKDNSIKNVAYLPPFNMALNYTMKIDKNGNEKIENYSVSFIPTTDELLNNAPQLMAILPTYNQEDEKEFILKIIDKNLNSLWEL